MAKPLKHPGLQRKFEAALAHVLASERALSGGPLLDAIKARRDEFGITEQEFDDLGRNMANYLYRAKQAGVLVSNGPHRGYSLAQVDALQDGDPPAGAIRDGLASAAPTPAAPLVPLSANAPSVEAPKVQQWESFFHLAATVCLARRFSARVVSLPKTTDRGVKWGNPDMLFVRASALSAMEPFLNSNGLDVERFALVDDSPRAVLSSVELKVGLGTNRGLWVQAVAETAANSLWANEAWLVYVDPDSPGRAPDPDVLALARGAQVGILEIIVRGRDRGRGQESGDDEGNDSGGQEASFELIEHRVADLRSRLRVGDVDAEERIGLLTAAHELLGTYEAEGTFLDVDGDEHKARTLLEQALENLTRQAGFARQRVSLSNAVQSLRQGRSALYRGLVGATLAEIEDLVTLASPRGAWGDIDAAIKRHVPYEQAEWLRSAIALFQADR